MVVPDDADEEVAGSDRDGTSRPSSETATAGSVTTVDSTPGDDTVSGSGIDSGVSGGVVASVAGVSTGGEALASPVSSDMPKVYHPCASFRPK